MRSIRWIAPALALCVLSGTAATAQMIRPVQPITVSATEGLTVHGHAEMKVKPDVAYIEIGVVTQSKDSTQAVQDNAAHASDLLKALRGAGLADKDIQSQSYNVQPQYDYQTSPAVLTGYQVTNTFRVTVRDLPKVGQVIDKATGAGGNQVNSVTFDLADRTQAEGQALSQAVASAKSKAGIMAQAAGVTLGRLLTLSDGTAPSVQPVEFSPAPMMKAAMAAPSTPIQSQDISVTADVTAVYALGL